MTEANAGHIIGGVQYSSNAAEFTVTVTDLDENGVHTGKLVATAQLTTTPNTREFTNVAGFEYDDNHSRERVQALHEQLRGRNAGYDGAVHLHVNRC